MKERVEIGVFIPSCNNGWLISKTAPQYLPSFELNRDVVLKAEAYDFDFALSMIKYRGFGGATRFWDYNLESFTLMAGLAPLTERIRLYGSVGTLSIPPAIAARMAVTIDDMSNGRFGVNIVTGWQRAEYDQMGLWPGDEHYARRYDHAAEYVRVMRDLWSTGRSDLAGDYFHMDDCRMLPGPRGPIPIICAGQSDAGMRFTVAHGDYSFFQGVGRNTPTAHAVSTERLAGACAGQGREIGACVLFMIIADETDERAMAKWQRYNDGLDHEAVDWLIGQASLDNNRTGHGSSRKKILPEGLINLNMGTLIGSYESVARMLDEAAGVPGTKGIMLCFDEYRDGIVAFGERIQPLMESRTARSVAAQ